MGWVENCREKNQRTSFETIIVIGSANMAPKYSTQLPKGRKVLKQEPRRFSRHSSFETIIVIDFAQPN